jgi:hypothetical protein
MMVQREIRYQNFEIRFERKESNFRVFVPSSEGEVGINFNIPFSEIELENFLLRMGRSRRGMRRVESPQMQAAKAFGVRLFEALFNGETRDFYRSALRAAEGQGYGLRLLLRFSDAPELVHIPWEYLYEPSLGRFVALSADTPIVRYLDVPRQVTPFKIQAPLRVLVMISSPHEYPELDVETEWKILNGALGDLVQRGQVSITRLIRPTLPALQEQLRKEEYHVFHFIGHGLFSDHKEDGLLLLEDEKGAGRPISGHYLGTLLHDEKSLRLALLNACEGGRTSISDPFAGTAQGLVHQGIPAVIAMQFEVSERTAATLTREFYRSLADNYPVDAALGEARKAIYTQGQDIEWGIPVLYMRSQDGQLFDVEPATDARSIPGPPAASAASTEKPDSGGVNVSIKGDVSGQFAAGNNITQVSKSDDDSDEGEGQ